MDTWVIVFITTTLILLYSTFGPTRSAHQGLAPQLGSQQDSLLTKAETVSSDERHSLLSSDSRSAVRVEDKLYKPLPSKTHIRLLVLHAGQASMLQGTLKSVDLAEEPTYEAVSYAWGNPRFIDKHIVINGHKISIKDNLWTALQKIRSPSESRTLWIDALCICQADSKEKAQQVLLIGNIIKQALRVLIWVGEHDRRSEELFKLSFREQNEHPEHLAKSEEVSELRKETRIRRLWQKLKKDNQGSQTENRSRRRKNSDQDLSSEENENPEKAERREIWAAFLRRKYWARRWIVQEILLAKDIVVHCGDSVMSWESLLETRYIKGSLGSLYLGRLDEFEHHDFGRHAIMFFYLVQLRKERIRSLSLLKLMCIFEEAKCTDDRDKVYALLAIDSGIPIIQPSYEITSDDLFIAVLEARFDQWPEDEQLEKTEVLWRVFQLSREQGRSICLKIERTSRYKMLDKWRVLDFLEKAI